MATPQDSDVDRTGSHSREHTGQTSTSAESTAKETAQKTKEKARHFSDRAKEQIAGQAEQQKTQARKQLKDIGSALRETSDTLHDRDKDSVASVMEGAAHQVERLSGYLRDRSVGDMMSDAERFARREPEMFLGGAAVLGLIGARFFRSSSPESGRTRHRGRRTPAPREKTTGDHRQGRRPAPQEQRTRAQSPKPAHSEPHRPETQEERRPSPKSRSDSQST